MVKDGVRRDWRSRIKEVMINFPESEKDYEKCFKLWKEFVEEYGDHDKVGKNPHIKIIKDIMKKDSISDATDLVLFISDHYDKFKKKEMDENVFGKILMDSRTIGKGNAPTFNADKDEKVKSIAGRAVKKDENFEKSVKQIFAEVIKRRGVEADMSATVSRWWNERKLEIDSKDVADAIISVNLNGVITENVKDQLLLKILARKNKEDINNKRSEDLQDEIEILKAHRLILGREGVTLDVLEKRLELDIEQSQKHLEVMKKNGDNLDEKFMGKIEKQLIARIHLWEKITKKKINFEEAYLSWIELEGSDLFTAFFLDELQNKMEQMTCIVNALKNNVIVLEEILNDVENGKSLKTLLLEKEFPEKISHLETVIKSIKNGKIVYKDSITEEVRDTLRQLFINRTMVDNGEVNPHSVGALILEMYDYDFAPSSFMTWLQESENEQKYLEESIESVFYSELIIPDIIAEVCLDIIRKPYFAETYAQTGISDECKKLNIKTIGSNEGEIRFWEDRRFEVEVDVEEANVEKKVRKKIAEHSFKMNSFLLPYMNIFKGNQKELQETILYGTTGTQEYCNVVEKTLDSTTKLLDKIEEKYNGAGACNPIDCGFRKVVNDMLMNELVGHRYATDLGEFLINFGKKGDTLFGNTVLNKMTAARINAQIEIKTKEGEISFWNMEFIEKCVTLPEYWQSIFWEILKIYLIELISAFARVVCNDIELDTDYRNVLLKRCRIPLNQLVEVLGKMLQNRSDEMNRVFGDKVNLILFILGKTDICNRFEDIIWNIENKDLFSPVTRKIWENMVDYTYYKEKTKRNKDFEILRNVKGKKVKGNKFSQRKTGKLYDKIGEAYLNARRT